MTNLQDFLKEMGLDKVKPTKLSLPSAYQMFSMIHVILLQVRYLSDD